MNLRTLVPARSLHLGTNRSTRAVGATVVALLLGVGLTACGADDGTDPEAGGGSTPVVGSDSQADDAADDADSIESAVAMSDPWVKAVPEGMTAAFGVLENSSDADITLVSAATDASPMVELHEMLMQDGAMVMQEKAGGIVIPAGGSTEISPGGDHIMLMGVADPIEPGDVITLTLTFDDGSTLDVEVTAKDYAGGDEEYIGDDEQGDEMPSHMPTTS